MPFVYKPITVKAITPEIYRACMNKEPSEEIVIEGPNGEIDSKIATLLKNEIIAINGLDIVVNSVDESQRMQSFTLYHKAWPSDYM